MHTLLLRLCGPMQSWGSESHFSLRTTNHSPTKSGVIGLCGAALGWSRSMNYTPLAELRFGCRIVQPGVLMMDFQTVKGVIVAKGKGTENVISKRYYLSDADFLVGLEGSDLKFLEMLHHALGHSKFCVYLGRKSYVPSRPVVLLNGLRKNEDLETALFNYSIETQRSERIDLILETSIEDAERTWFDQPIKDSYFSRKFEARGLLMKSIQVDREEN